MGARNPLGVCGATRADSVHRHTAPYSRLGGTHDQIRSLEERSLWLGCQCERNCLDIGMRGHVRHCHGKLIEMLLSFVQLIPLDEGPQRGGVRGHLVGTPLLVHGVDHGTTKRHEQEHGRSDD